MLTVGYTGYKSSEIVWIFHWQQIFDNCSRDNLYLKVDIFGGEEKWI